MTKPRQTKTRQIFVRRYHIQEGECRDPNRCVLKLAIADDYHQRGFKVARLAVKGNGVTATTTAKDGTNITEKWLLPDKAYRAIYNFDKCEKRIAADPDAKYAIVGAAGVHPFSFRMHRAHIMRRKPMTKTQNAKKKEYRISRVKYFQKRGLPVPAGYLGLTTSTHNRLDSVLTS